MGGAQGGGAGVGASVPLSCASESCGYEARRFSLSVRTDLATVPILGAACAFCAAEEVTMETVAPLLVGIVDCAGIGADVGEPEQVQLVVNGGRGGARFHPDTCNPNPGSETITDPSSLTRAVPSLTNCSRSC